MSSEFQHYSAQESAQQTHCLSQNLKANHFAYLPGDHLASTLGIEPHAWRDFAAYWERLTLDRYMADGGTYRYRRYGACAMHPTKPKRWLAHAAYEQPKYINSLNGGVARMFDPLEDGFANHRVFNAILEWLASVFDQCEQAPRHWNIKLHPYRITADGKLAGQPTPEGLHRDGVDYIVTLLVHRENILGGESIITDNLQQPRWQRTLCAPMDIIVANDHKTMHAVTAITPKQAGYPAHRDVLVLAFTHEPL
jgi:hypothetical protein